MPGGVTRKVGSLYQKPDAAEGSGMGRGRGRGRGKGGGKGRGKGRATSPIPLSSSSSEEEEEEEVKEQVEEVPPTKDSGDEEGEEDTGGGDVWLRGPSQLPDRPIPLARRPLIRPLGARGWEILSAGDHKRMVNGILGLLCRLHFPGLVQFAGREEPAYTWEHYIAFPDARDQDGRLFRNKAERVKGELWDFFRCDEGYDDKAGAVAHNACKKLVVDMHYEAQVQAVITYHASKLRVKISKKDARKVKLTREQYMEVPAWWCVSDLRCWAHIVDKWFDPQWEEKHNAGRKRRLLMPGPSHHQGNVSLNEYRAKWSASHDGQPCSQFKAWVLAHKGKATSDVDYNPDDPPSAYTNPAVHSRVSDYNSMAKQVYGPEYDPSTHDLDGEIVTMVGHRKKRVRYYRGDDTLDATPTPTTSQTRAKSSSSNLTICPQPDTAQRRVEALEAQLAEERRKREENEAQLAEERRRREANEAKIATHEAKIAANEAKMDQMYKWIQGLSQQLGQALSPMIFHSPLTTPPNQSLASNTPVDIDLSAGLSPQFPH